MKKLIHPALIALTLASAASHANESATTSAMEQNKLSYACNVMLKRGSKMFCGNEVVANNYAKAAISELAYATNTSYACNTMAERGSEMFCEKEKASTFAQANNN
jgi:hypothetical protein